jgi:hypothetical protein
MLSQSELSIRSQVGSFVVRAFPTKFSRIPHYLVAFSSSGRPRNLGYVTDSTYTDLLRRLNDTNYAGNARATNEPLGMGWDRIDSTTSEALLIICPMNKNINALGKSSNCLNTSSKGGFDMYDPMNLGSSKYHIASKYKCILVCPQMERTTKHSKSPRYQLVV